MQQDAQSFMAGSAAATQGAAGRILPRMPAAVPLLLLTAALLALNPAGYVGGGSDDWHYLLAAEC